MCVSLFILFQLLYSGWINNDCGSNVYTKIIENFPIVFKLSNGQWRCPKNVMDVPVYLDGQLTNFMEVKDKEGPYGLCFGDINHIRFKSV